MATSSNRRAEMRRKQAATATATATSRRTMWWIVGGVLLAIALSAVVAIVTSGDDAVAVPAGYEQTRPVTVTGVALPSLPDNGVDPALGMTAPVITGQSFDGTVVTTEGARPTLIAVVAHWCPHCRAEVPRLVEWQRSGAMPRDLDVVVVSTAVSENSVNFPPSTWLENNEDVTWPVLADDAGQSAATALGTSGFPYFVLLRADGTVAWRATGEQDVLRLTATIEAALA